MWYIVDDYVDELPVATLGGVRRLPDDEEEGGESLYNSYMMKSHERERWREIALAIADREG